MKLSSTSAIMQLLFSLSILMGYPLVAFGQIVVNEIMINAGDGQNTQWFELYNTGPARDIGGWRLYVCNYVAYVNFVTALYPRVVDNRWCVENDCHCSTRVIAPNTRLDAGGYIVVDDGGADNGGIPGDIQWDFPSFFSDGRGGTSSNGVYVPNQIMVVNPKPDHPSGEIVDLVIWDTSPATPHYFLPFEAGASLAVIKRTIWEVEWAASPTLLPCLGVKSKCSPKQNNNYRCPTKAPTKAPTTPMPRVVVNEIMINANDGWNTQWFELFNPNGMRDLVVSGWMLKVCNVNAFNANSRNGSAMTFDPCWRYVFTANTTIPRGGYLVVANGNQADNGGILVDILWDFPRFLPNGTGASPTSFPGFYVINSISINQFGVGWELPLDEVTWDTSAGVSSQRALPFGPGASLSKIVSVNSGLLRQNWQASATFLQCLGVVQSNAAPSRITTTSVLRPRPPPSDRLKPLRRRPRCPPHLRLQLRRSHQPRFPPNNRLQLRRSRQPRFPHYIRLFAPLVDRRKVQRSIPPRARRVVPRVDPQNAPPVVPLEDPRNVPPRGPASHPPSVPLRHPRNILPSHQPSHLSEFRRHCLKVITISTWLRSWCKMSMVTSYNHCHPV
jgi:hypothetical protein